MGARQPAHGQEWRRSYHVGAHPAGEADHDALLAFVEAAHLDWCGFFAYSAEDGTYATSLDGAVDRSLAHERLGELDELQSGITARKRDEMIGCEVEVLVDEPGIGRTYREAPEIDGIVAVSNGLEPGEFATVVVSGAEGPDLRAS